MWHCSWECGLELCGLPLARRPTCLLRALGQDLWHLWASVFSPVQCLGPLRVVLCASHVHSQRPTTPVSMILGAMQIVSLAVISLCGTWTVTCEYARLLEIFSNMFYRGFDLYKLRFLSFLHGTSTTAICGQMEKCGRVSLFWSYWVTGKIFVVV